MLTNGVVPNNDNAQPHVTVVTVETVQRLKYKFLPCPSYSPDLALSDYHIFRPLIDAICGH
jgi:histone-lysine N-methyltransferase SETMAR